MKVNEAILNIVFEFSSKIPRDIGVTKIFLFGSYAKGTQHQDSDIDLAIIIPNNKDIFETQMQLMRLRRNIDLRIEPHPINISDFNEVNPLANEILTYGLEIFYNA